jgi:hypothetical protein
MSDAEQGNAILRYIELVITPLREEIAELKKRIETLEKRETRVSIFTRRKK